jgi:N,N'-diacetyllegionaminate synthase
MDKTLIIAEAGSNHNGSIKNAFKLIDVAANAGADVIKFQNYTAKKLFTTKANKVNNHDVFELFKPLEMPDTWVKDLIKYSESRNIEFMSTPFDDEAVDYLYNLGVKRFKVSGFESTDLRHIKYVASTKLPIIVSAGIGCSLEFIQEIIDTCNNVGCNDVTILHCNNAYPTPQKDINLNTIQSIIEKYGDQVKVGLSDHTLSALTPSFAVAMGAKCIEKHFTLSKDMQGPDHFFALEPHQLSEMVSNIRTCEESLGYKKGFTDSEISCIQGRRSVILKNNVSKGDVLSVDNLTTKRPYYGNAIQAKDYFRFVEGDYIFNRDIERDEFLFEKDIEVLNEKK